MLEKLGEKQIPEEEIPAGLAATADELIRLRADLAHFRMTDRNSLRSEHTCQH
jgi:hypothetical protein